MLKVLHSVLSLETGGLENGVVNLVNAAPEDIHVDILCLRAVGELADRIKNPNSRVLTSPSISLNDHSILSAVQAHLRVLKEGSYDIVHTHGWATMLSGFIASYLFPLMSFKKRPLIINGEHGVFYENNWRQKHIQKFLFKSMDANLSVSSDLGHRLESAFNLDKGLFKTILNGVNTNQFNLQPEARFTIRNQLNICDSEVVIGSVGRLVPVKNYPLMLEAFNALTQIYPNRLRLVLCGDGVERDRLEELVQQLNLTEKVFFAGRINNVHEWMQAFDIFALSSNTEGLPNTLLEAMSLGIPSVVTDVGGSREVLPASCGHLTPAQNLEAYISALKDLVSNANLRCEMGAAASSHVRNHLSMNVMAENYYTFYRDLLIQCNRS